MVTKQETICDGCKKRTADKKCCWCGKDLCPHCRRGGFDVVLRSVDILQMITEVTFCKDCKHKLKDKFGNELDGIFDVDFGEEMRGRIQGYLTKRMVSENL